MRVGGRSTVVSLFDGSQATGSKTDEVEFRLHGPEGTGSGNKRLQTNMGPCHADIYDIPCVKQNINGSSCGPISCVIVFISS